jgi:pyruvate formate lyase activating enzyme
MARRSKLAGVAWTYNDPVIWIEYVHDLAVEARRAGLYTAFVTASYINPEPLDYLAPHLDAYKYDLKASGPGGWSWLSKVKDPEITLEMTVRAQERHGCHVEVVSNIIPGMNDDEGSLRQMADQVRDRLGPKTPWHLTRFLPDFELSYLPPTPIKSLEKGVTVGHKAGLEFVYVGNVPGHPMRHTACPRCGRTAVRRGERGAEEIWLREGRCQACGEDLNLLA